MTLDAEWFKDITTQRVASMHTKLKLEQIRLYVQIKCIINIADINTNKDGSDTTNDNKNTAV